MPAFVVERYWPQVSVADVDALAERLRAAATQVTDVTYLGSVLLVEDDVVQCRFEAADAAAVRHLNDVANAPYDRVLLARPYPA